MRKNSLLALLILVLVSFGIAGGCSDSENGDDNGGMPTPSPTPTASPNPSPTPSPSPSPSPSPGPSPSPSPNPSPTPTPGPGGSIIEEGGTISEDPVSFAYIEDGNSRHFLDFYEITGLESQELAAVSSRAEDGKRPAIVFLHGGAWLIGDKGDVQDEDIIFEAAEAGGFHIISVGYRLAGLGPENAPWPAQAHDANAAIRWIKQNSEMLGVDPEKLILLGGSAGAHIAAAVAMGSDADELLGAENIEPPTSTDVALAVLIFGAYDMNMIVQDGLDLIEDMTCGPEVSAGILGILALLECPFSFNPIGPLDNCNQNDLDLASPEMFVDSTDPPTYLAHGRDDCVVPYLQTVGMTNTLEAAGVTTNGSMIVEGGEHDVGTLNLSVEDIIEFIDSNVTH